MHMAVLGGRVQGEPVPRRAATQYRLSGVTVPTGRYPTFDKAGPVKTGPVQLYGLPTG